MSGGRAASAEARREAWARAVILPALLLTVALLGGLRIRADGSFLFVAPPLVTLLLAVLLLSLFVRGRLLDPGGWISARHTGLTNASHVLTLLALFFASAQAFNSVLPDAGLLHWMFTLFFLWTLWNDQFSPFDARRLLRSVAVLFGTAFLLKHVLLAGLSDPERGWARRLMGALLEGVSLGTLDLPEYGPATGYVSFFTLALYVCSLLMIPPPRALALSAPTAALEAYPGERP